MKNLFLILLFALFSYGVSAQTKDTTSNKNFNPKSENTGRVEIKISDLNKTITDYIATNYKDYKIEKAMRIEGAEKNNYKYKVTISNGEGRKAITFNNTFEFIKEYIPKNSPKQK